MRKTLIGVGSAALLAATLTACGNGDAGTGGTGGTGTEAEGEVTTITVGATPQPHGEILRFVDDELAADAGIDLEITEYTDYQIPNRALADGELDANFFQHVPFFEQQVEQGGYDLTHFEGVHIEPLGVYSANLTSLDDLPDGAEIGIPNDPTNQGRALALLAENGVITLAEGVEPTGATTNDIAENPQNVSFTPLDAAQIPRSLSDFDAAVINGNYALEGGLSPADDALALESGENNPYANVLAVRTEDAEVPAIQTLDELLHSEEVRQFIDETYTDGSVVPAF